MNTHNGVGLTPKGCEAMVRAVVQHDLSERGGCLRGVGLPDPLTIAGHPSQAQNWGAA
jgi:hypothetical protein